MKPGRLSFTVLLLLLVATQAATSRAQQAMYLSEYAGAAGEKITVYNQLPYAVDCYIEVWKSNVEDSYIVFTDYLYNVYSQQGTTYVIPVEASPGEHLLFYCEDPARLKTAQAAGELKSFYQFTFEVTEGYSPPPTEYVPPTFTPVPQTVFGSITTASGTRSNDGCASNPTLTFSTAANQIVVVALAYNVQPRQSYAAYWYYNGGFVYQHNEWVAPKGYRQLCLSYAIDPSRVAFQPGDWYVEVVEYPDKISSGTNFVIQQPPPTATLIPPPTFTPRPPTLPPPSDTPTLIPSATLTWTPTYTPTFTATPTSTATQPAAVVPVPTTSPNVDVTPLASFLGPILDALKKVPVEFVVTIGLGTLGTLAITGIRRVTRRRRISDPDPLTGRALWERQAQFDEPGIPCQQGRFYCKKVKINTTLTRYKIGSLKLTAYDRVNQTSPLVREIKGAVLDDLNKALEARRRGEPADYLMQLLIPASNHLQREVIEWLHAHPDSHDVAVNGHVEGSNMKFKFTLYVCVPAAYQNAWEVESEWEKTVTDAWDSPISLIPNVHHNMTGKPPEDLSRELITFIQGI